MGLKVSAITNKHTELVFNDDDRLYLVAADTPSPTEFQSQVMEGRVMKQIIGGISKTIISPSELLDIYLSPISLVSDTFENPSIIVPQQFVIKFDYATTAYATEFTLEIKENPDNPDSIVELTDVLKFTADKLYSVIPPNDIRECYVENLDLVVRGKAANPTLGDSTLTIWTIYKVIEL